MMLTSLLVFKTVTSTFDCQSQRMSSVPPPYSEHTKYHGNPPLQQHQPHSEANNQPPIPLYQYPQSQPSTLNPNAIPHVTVVSQQPTGVIIHTIPILDNVPVNINCMHCNTFTQTKITHEISGRTHCCALALCLLGMWPCVPIPYCCGGGCCQKTLHTCGNCGKFIGSF